ncbi:MAG: 1-acyl-sn-glycerol-3-phosphate acyltransferase [Gammaproteobacteria bacterium]|nr:1-acyl-sn-glycerol-3-phosphate acyltransferase [Gammaproteobacteria bacterium]
MNRILKIIFVALIAKPVVLILLGLNVLHREKLPKKGPAIIAVNHNSHLDTIVLLSLYPLSLVHKLRPVAAADYFLSNSIVAWFSLNVIGIIPLARKGAAKRDLFSDCHKALDNKDILLIFPEGTRGEPEVTSKPKRGIYYLVKDRDDVTIMPVVTHGLGRALPKGEALLVPFNCDVVVGDAIDETTSSTELMHQLSECYKEQLLQCLTYHENS